MTTLPIVSGADFRRPSVLAGQPNGRLPASLLTTIVMPGGGTAVVLAQAAPKWQALLAAAARAGFPLSQVGDYRTYDEQVALFRERFATYDTGTGVTRKWNGQVWWLRKGEALAAVPGTSNHGWGLALDLCMAGGRSITDAAVAWLCAHAREFGISAETASENWHWRPDDGDHFTAAVLSHMEEDMPRLARVRNGQPNEGAIYITTGVECRHIVDEADLKTQAQVFGLTAWADVDAAQVQYLGRDVSAGTPLQLDVAELAALLTPALQAAVPSHDELAQAAFEGAQRAERE